MLEPRRREPRRVLPAVLLVLAVAGLAGAALWLLRLSMQEGVSLILAAAVAITSLVAWERRQRAARRAPRSSDEVAAATHTLAEVVLAQWRHEARLRGLEDPAPMPVRWRLASARVMDHPEVISPDGLSFEGCGDDIAQLVASFRALPRRRLVVIGGPGVGKTTLAVQMVVALLTDRRDDEPVPVVLSLIDYDPSGVSPQEWLVGRLRRDYPGLTEPLASALVQRGRVLPVLDGLDEVPADRQAGILRALNMAADGVDGFILTSRRPAYLRALSDSGDVLTAAAVIAPLALPVPPHPACSPPPAPRSGPQRSLDARHGAARGRPGARPAGGRGQPPGAVADPHRLRGRAA